MLYQDKGRVESCYKKGLGWARKQLTGLCMEIAYDPGAWHSWGQRKYRAHGVMLDQGLWLLLLIVKRIPPPHSFQMLAQSC